MKFKLIHAWEHRVSAEQIYLFFLDVRVAVILKVGACEAEVYNINIGGVKNVTIRLRKLF